MKFTDLFIRRPVLSMVVSLMILLIGLRSIVALPILQFPKTESGQITITTTYYGADPALVAGFITTAIEDAVAQANGIDYMTSSSKNGVSVVTVNLRLNYDSDRALSEVSAKVNSVLNQLPPGSQQPVIAIEAGSTQAAMYIGFESSVLKTNQLTDYLTRVVKPKLQTVTGVQSAEILGGQNFAMRIWLDPDRLAAHGLTASDISQALANNDYLSGLGTTKGQMIQVNLTASTSLHSAEAFRKLVVSHVNGAIVRLEDVANVTLGADDYDSAVGFSGRPALAFGIQLTPAANLLDVIAGVHRIFPDIQAQLPQGVTGLIIFEASKFVNSAINEVILTLVEAVGIVTLVTFAFLGSPRAVAVPVIAIPLSLVGTFTMMLLFGFSINLLTLLALVLAIGLVVDDAIIVVENVNRHLEEGMSRLDASLRAARELAGPIIAMTLVLIAVYVPIGFQGGLTGALFTEFAFTLVGAVTISAVIALTLSPMMCSRLLKPHLTDRSGWEERLVDFIDRRFEEVAVIYRYLLRGSLNNLPVVVVLAGIVTASIYFLYSGSKTELAPPEDQGFLIAVYTPPPDATLAQREMYMPSGDPAGMPRFPEIAASWKIDSPEIMVSGFMLKPWRERTRSAAEIQQAMQMELNGITGLQAVAFLPPSLPGAFGMPVQFVLTSSNSFDRMDGVAQGFLTTARRSGMFMFLNSDLRLDQPQYELVIDRDKTAELGLKMSDVGSALSAMLGGGYVNYFSLSGRSYKVIPQVQQRSRLTSDQLLDYHIKAADGTSVPLSTIVRIETHVVPESINHFQQLNSAMIQGVPAPGVTTGQALAYLQTLAAKELPQGYTVDYAGPARQFIQTSGGFVETFGFALVVIFLALAAQFESFRDPLIILVSVPLSIAGALLFIHLGVGGASLNIYTEVGLVTLMGLISKHGILIVEFANKGQTEQGLSKREAIERAAEIRLRPILMTTAAMVLSVVPLVTATGAGAASRFNMGLVIGSGLAFGTLFTLLVVPVVYMLLATDRRKQRHKEEAVAIRSQA